MGRRNSEFTRFLNVAVTWPWQISTLLAPVSFLACHITAVRLARPVPAHNVRDLGLVVILGFVHFFAQIGEIILPVGFAIAGLVAFIKSLQGRKLFTRFHSVEAEDPDLGSLSWQQFESLIAEAFRYRGYQVTAKGGAAPDGGIDLIATQRGERFLIQCKHWRARKVPVSVVRELYGVMTAHNAAGGFVVTSGAFTEDAIEFAAGRNMTLIGGGDLQGLLRDGRLMTLGATSSPTKPPNCPTCLSPMVQRTATRGAHAGQPFWGCANYPKCRQIVGCE